MGRAWIRAGVVGVIDFGAIAQAKGMRLGRRTK